jgi:hypothetical protein
MHEAYIVLFVSCARWCCQQISCNLPDICWKAVELAFLHNIGQGDNAAKYN